MKMNLGIYNRDMIDAVYVIQHTIYNRSFSNVEIEIAIDGEMIINKDSWRSRHFSRATLAYIIKQEIKNHFGNDKEKCAKDSNEIITFAKSSNYSSNKFFRDYSIDLKIPVKHMWVLYDILLNHKIDRIIKFYGKDVVDKVIGQPLNPMLIEQEKLRLEEIEKIKAEFKLVSDETYNLFRVRNQQLQEEYDKAKKRIKDQETMKINEVNAQFAEMKKMAESMGL